MFNVFNFKLIQIHSKPISFSITIKLLYILVMILLPFFSIVLFVSFIIQNLTTRESLHCMQTAFTILSGQGSVLNIDPAGFYKQFYCNIVPVCAGIVEFRKFLVFNQGLIHNEIKLLN